MTTAETIFMSALAGHSIAVLILNRLQKTLIKGYDNLLKDYRSHLKEMEKKTEVVLEYCLLDIFKQAIEKEDFEEAQRCKDVLATLKK